MEEYAINSYKNEKSEDRIKIDIYSPFFESLFKKNFIHKIYEIIIPVDIIAKFNLKKEYIATIEKLNKLETNMNRVCINFKYTNPDDIYYLIDLKLNFKFIKKLKIRNKKGEQEKEKEKQKEKEKENNIIESQTYDNFYKILFSLPDIKNVLIDLDLENNSEDIFIPNSFELINKFKVLKNLTITGYIFQNTFILKLYDLKKLDLFKVKNFAFDKSIPFNLNELYISSSELCKSKELMNFSKLEIFEYINSYNLSINIQNSKHLKKISMDSKNLIELTHADLSSLTSLEEIEIFDKEYISHSEIIKKLLLIKNLKSAELNFINFDSAKIEIEGENLSLRTLRFFQINEECKVIGLEKIFPNINSILVHSYETIEDLSDHWCLNCRQAGYFIWPTEIKIKENKNCKIDKIALTGEGSKYIELYCHSYDSLKEIKIEIENKTFGLEIPMFNDASNIIFKSLVNFTFVNISETRFIEIRSDVFKNIYKNIDNMPNRKIFIMKCYIRYIDNEEYFQFIRKLLSKDLDEIILYLKYYIKNIVKYSREELQQI